MMRVKIHRGQNQIGGSIIEIAADHARIILDVGIELNESAHPVVPEIEGLFCGEPRYNAVFVSHYHSDHVGLAEKILPNIPIYMGEKAFDIMKTLKEYRENSAGFLPGFMRNGESIIIGDLKITPVSCDHSAFDSYMLLIENEDSKVLYTGDFRANGRGEFDELLKSLPIVDVMIIEGTMLSRGYDGRNMEEENLEKIGTEFLTKYDGPAFVFCSATNVDRLITVRNIARNTGRVFLEDVYTAQIAEQSGVMEISPVDRETYVFQTDGSDKQHSVVTKYNFAKIGRNAIAKTKFIMTVRPSMKRYLEKLSEKVSFQDGVLFYALWKGYQENGTVRDFLDFMEQKGCKIHVLHTSGHADRQSIDELVNAVKPKKIIPVHTENAEYFMKFSKSVEVIINTNEISV